MRGKVRQQVLVLKAAEGFKTEGATVVISKVETLINDLWVKRVDKEAIGKIDGQVRCQLEISDSLKDPKKRTHDQLRAQGKEPKRKMKKSKESENDDDEERVSVGDFLTKTEETLQKIKKEDINSPLAHRLNFVAKKCKSIIEDWKDIQVFGHREKQQQQLLLTREEEFEALRNRLRDANLLPIKFFEHENIHVADYLFLQKNEYVDETYFGTDLEKMYEKDNNLEEDDNTEENDFKQKKGLSRNPSNKGIHKHQYQAENKSFKNKETSKKTNAIDFSSYLSKKVASSQHITTPTENGEAAGRQTPNLRKKNDSSEVEKALKPADDSYKFLSTTKKSNVQKSFFS